MIMKSIKKVKITCSDALKAIGAILGFYVVFLAIVLAVGNYDVWSFETDVNNQQTISMYCAAGRPEPEIALIVIEVINLLVAASYASSVSALPGAVNESKQILAGY